MKTSWEKRLILMPDIQTPEPVHAKGNIVRQPIEKTDDFAQAGERYRLLNPQERANLCDNIAVELVQCSPGIVKRVLSYFEKADGEFAEGVQRDMKKYSK